MELERQQKSGSLESLEEVFVPTVQDNCIERFNSKRLQDLNFAGIYS
jgi:hypothetical protein